MTNAAQSLRVEAEAAPDSATIASHLAMECLERRRSVPVTGLAAPGPDAAEVRRLLTVAARVPDHGALTPWRFIVVEGDARTGLARRLAALIAAEPALQAQAAAMAQKITALFTAAPLVVVVVSRAAPGLRIPEWEQVLSAGAVCMNLITAATALGYGANWLTGWPSYDPGALAVLGVGADERVAGIVPIGRATQRPPDRPRPALAALVTAWTENAP